MRKPGTELPGPVIHAGPGVSTPTVSAVQAGEFIVSSIGRDGPAGRRAGRPGFFVGNVALLA
jgi:hypothetical protein